MKGMTMSYRKRITRVAVPALGLVALAFLLLQTRALTGGGTTALSATTPPAPLTSSVIMAEGRVAAYPGNEVITGSDRSGTIVRMFVNEKDEVTKGQVIARLRSDDLEAELAEARARVAEAEADIRLYDVEVSRSRHLWEEEVGSKQAYDRSLRDRDAALARRRTSLAAAQRLEALIDKTRILAPISGVIVERFVDEGESIEAGDSIVTVANLDRLRIEAEVDEFDTARLAIGADVIVIAEGFDREWRGTVQEVPDAVTARRLKPQDPARPVDARVLLAKVEMQEQTPLKLGQRVEVRIATE